MQAVVVHTFNFTIPALGSLRQVDLCEFRAHPDLESEFQDNQRNPI